MLILSLHTFKLLCPVLNSPDPGFVSIQKHWNSPCLKWTHWRWRWKGGEKNQTWSKYFSIYSICLSLSCIHFFIAILKTADGFVHLVLSYTILLHLGPIWGMRLFEISQHVTYNACRSSPNPLPIPNFDQLWSCIQPLFSFITLVHIYVYRTATDVLWRHLEDGTRVRVSKHSGRIIPIPINEEQKTEGDNIAVNSYVGKAHQLHMGKS